MGYVYKDVHHKIGTLVFVRHGKNIYYIAVVKFLILNQKMKEDTITKDNIIKLFENCLVQYKYIKSDPKVNKSNNRQIRQVIPYSENMCYLYM